MKFAIVAPVVRTPPHSAGNRKSCFSQSRASSSHRVPIGDESHAEEIWSHVEVSTSAASAAGVPPPTTQWKKRGPEARSAPSEAATSSAIAASAPSPSSGKRALRRIAAASAPSRRTGSWSIFAR